jgi:AraC family transcriptional activator of tynA and feaB
MGRAHNGALFSRHSRSAYWSESYCAGVEQAELTPSDPIGYACRFTGSDLGMLKLTAFESAGAAIERHAGHIGTPRARFFSFILVEEGALSLRHHGRDAQLRAGSLTLLDSNAPYRIDIAEQARIYFVRAPDHVVRKYLPSPEAFSGVALQSEGGLSEAATAMLQAFCTDNAPAVAAEFRQRVAQHIIELLSTSFAMAFGAGMGRSSVINSHHVKVKLFIEQHLRDPDLSPSAIARALSLSSRYLRMIFAIGEETVSAYILRRRLEECARQMADPRWRGHSITEIAFGWGFNSAPHFTRSFRGRFDESPREYRRRELEGTAPVEPRAASSYVRSPVPVLA